MFFTKNEVVELDDEKKFVVIDVTLLNNEVYYQVQEVNSEGVNVVGEKKVIMAVNENSTLYIEDVMDENKLLSLKGIFTG